MSGPAGRRGSFELLTEACVRRSRMTRLSRFRLRSPLTLPLQSRHSTGHAQPASSHQGSNMKLDGNTILITGGASGIGLALAGELQKRGNTVIITGRNLTKLEKAK